MKPRHGKFKAGGRNIDIAKVVAFRSALLRWWQKFGRKFPWRDKDASLYHKIVSEVLLQRTRAETVAVFWKIFVVRFPDWASLADSSIDEIERVLQPIGLSKQRAPRLFALAKALKATNGKFSEKREHIEELPGVGQYIANAIFTFAHDIPEPLLDTNMARVVERYFGARKLADIRYDPYLQSISRVVVNSRKGVYLNWAVLDLAAAICTIREPHCAECPLAVSCTFAARAKIGSGRGTRRSRRNTRKRLGHRAKRNRKSREIAL
jgi:A/G-specific adenine glycosylase